MSQRSQPPTDVLGSLPHRRPSRRSKKRAKSGATGGNGRRPSAQASQGREAATSQPASAVEPEPGSDVLGTVFQAAAELAEIGISATARAVREAVARLPRP